MDSEDKIIPFSIFISTYRRKKILAAMMGKTNKEKEEGSRILNNYKKQLAEKMARERADRGETLSQTNYSQKKSAASSSKGGDTTKKSSRVVRTKKTKKMEESVTGAESMEPEILLRILFGKNNGKAAPTSSGFTSAAASTYNHR